VLCGRRAPGIAPHAGSRDSALRASVAGNAPICRESGRRMPVPLIAALWRRSGALIENKGVGGRAGCPVCSESRRSPSCFGATCPLCQKGDRSCAGLGARRKSWRCLRHRLALQRILGRPGALLESKGLARCAWHPEHPRNHVSRGDNRHGHLRVMAPLFCTRAVIGLQVAESVLNPP